QRPADRLHLAAAVHHRRAGGAGDGLQTACTSPQPSTTGGLAALETTCTIRQRGAVVMKQTLLTAAGKTSAYSLSYAGLAEAYDASQAEIRAVRESLRFE
ncbi:DUF4946 domain-containing protein, partial [Pseudomonas aeruginosa]|nr:DUF4946 domain-containing protein [Pseudomonas aeruginosa]